MLNGGLGVDTLSIVDNVAGMGILAPSATLTSVEKFVVSTNGGLGVAAVAGTTAVAQVNKYTFASAPGGATDTLVVNYGGQASTITTGATKISAAAALAAAINNAAGRTIAVSDGVDTVTVTAPVAGIALPAITFGAATAAADIPTTTFQTANVAGVAGVAAAAYDLSAFSSLTDINATVAGAANLKASATANVTVTDTAGGVTLVGGLTQNVTAKGGYALSGSKGAITVVDSAQGAVNSTVDDGTSVSITSTSKNAGGTTGTITVGGTSAPTGDITINSTISEAKGTTNTAGGAITVTGGAAVVVNQTAVKAVQTADGLANGTITNAAVTVNGAATTTSVVAKASAAVAAVGTTLAVAGVTEVSTVTFGALTAGQTLTINGLTFTAGSSGTTAAQTAAAFANLTAGATQGNSTKGTYSGTFNTAGYTTGAVGGTSTAPTVVFTGTAAGNIADIALTGTGAGASSTVVTTAGVNAVDAAGKVGVTANTVSITDVNNGSATKAGTITSATAENYTTFTFNGNALSTLNLTGGSGNITISNGGLTTATNKTLNLTVNGLTGGTLDDADIYTTLNVTATGKSSTLANITDTALTALNVAGDKTLTLTSTAGASALANVTVTGSAGLKATFAATTMKSIDTTGTTGASTITFDATKATYTGGAGVDNVTTSAVAPTKAISLGDGNDKLTLALGTTSVTGAISGGAGTDTLSMVVADAATADNDLAFSALVTGFEVLELTGATGAQAVNLANLGITSTVTIGTHSGPGTLSVSNLVNGGTVTIAAQNATSDILELTNAAWAATGSSSDAVTINLGSATAAASAQNGEVQVKSVESITLNATHATVDATTGAAIAAGTYSNTIIVQDTTTTDTLASLTVNGNAAVVLDVTGSTALRTIDASANTGGVSVTAASTLSATLTGGSGNDFLTAHAATSTLADTLVGGAGKDTLTSNAGLTTLTGGTGNDLFVIAAAGANGNVYTTITDATAGDRIQLLDVASGSEAFVSSKLTLASTASFADYLNFATDSTTGAATGVITWFQYNGNTYIVEDASNSADFVNGTDVVVALNGLIDLSTASLSYNASGAPVLLFA